MSSTTDTARGSERALEPEFIVSSTDEASSPALEIIVSSTDEASSPGGAAIVSSTLGGRAPLGLIRHLRPT